MNKVKEKHIEEAVIMLSVFEVYIDIPSLKSDCRDSDLVFNRALVAAFLRSKGYTLQAIGEYLNRGHANVIHLLKYPKKRNSGGRRAKHIIDTCITVSTKKVIMDKIKLLEKELLTL